MAPQKDDKKVLEYDELKSTYDVLKEKHFKQAYWFWLGILIFIFIATASLLVVFWFFDCSSLIRYIGLTATLLSIVLSIFAIMFTYTANQQMGDRYNDISKAANDIRLTASLMREEMTSVRERMDSIESRINQMQNMGGKNEAKNPTEPQYGVSNNPSI